MSEKKIDKELIRHIALLARIEMTDEQAETLGRQFTDIVAYVDKLGELDTEGVEPMAHALDVRNVLAEDTPGESLSVEQAMTNAPARDGDFYRVPKVIGDSQ
ncbi:MAG: Asp-tRNA(Asn)/Glu-tRNA(Gln) amidotransferase subunit GatC [Planctomycetota bacterium]|nr:Asp-tRNA(Asn)/Glu-tRNA(Gln) amidotransferase subunit GatC [Planctomycetota bacterium]